MIVYAAHYELGKPAMIKKVIEDVDGDFIETGVNFYNIEEREFLSDEIIAQHLDNLLLYFKDISASSTMVPVGSHQTTYLIPQWSELNDIFQEIVSWWNFLSYRPENDESGHYHDPVTGEHVSAPVEEEPAP
jgi:hypothetical protein